MTEEYILGGYTRRINDGLYRVNFNATKGDFDQPEKIADLNSPTFMALSPDKDWLFAIDADDQTELAGLVTFVNHDGAWVREDAIYHSEIPGCHVTYRESSRTIYVANYHEGAIDVYGLNDDDRLTFVQRVQNQGQSVHPNQTSSHMHYTGIFLEDHFLLACDLGTDEVLTYELADDGQLTEVHRLKTPAGMGPRHLVKHPSLDLVYLIGELNNTTAVCQLQDDGSLEILQVKDNLSQVPEGIEPAGAAIRVSQDGRFLYVTTRFTDTLTVFAIDEITGHLSPIQEVSTQGEIPRDFILSKDDTYLLIPHQDSDHLSVFQRNSETGRVSFLQAQTRAPECVAIALAD